VGGPPVGRVVLGDVVDLTVAAPGTPSARLSPHLSPCPSLRIQTRQRRQPQKSCAALDDAHIREHHQVDRRRTEGHGLDREGCPGTGSSGPASDVWHYMYIFKCVLRCGLAGILTRSQPYDINVISAS